MLRYEEVNVSEATQSLMVKVAPSLGNVVAARGPHTIISAHPPVTPSEHDALAIRSDLSSDFAGLLPAIRATDYDCRNRNRKRGASRMVSICLQ